ncbi:MAG: GNAT family N-acetyltransferase [Stenotrophobium sp.]
MRREAVTTWYLETRSPQELRPARVPDPAPLIMHAQMPLPALNRFLYSAVGGDWHWTDRLGWSHARWLQYLDRPQLQTWVMHTCGTPAGYVELEAQAGGDVELAYFGLLPQFIGKGLGGHLLSVAIRRAWEMHAVKRVWVHTCTLDGPQALTNYQARGMVIYKSETVDKELAETPRRWPDDTDAH